MYDYQLIFENAENVKHRSKNETKRLSRAVAIYLKEKRENG